ncbi:hypothetical protein [Dasineura jujubifolia toursvirus 2a]|nr:hypothetical protein [Dasineura jujubifolia toursvirus 2a]
MISKFILNQKITTIKVAPNQYISIYAFKQKTGQILNGMIEIRTKLVGSNGRNFYHYNLTTQNNKNLYKWEKNIASNLWYQTEMEIVSIEVEVNKNKFLLNEKFEFILVVTNNYETVIDSIIIPDDEEPDVHVESIKQQIQSKDCPVCPPPIKCPPQIICPPCNNESLISEKNTLEKERNTLKNEKNILEKERNTLKNEKNTLEKERNTLKNEKSTLEKERNTLKNEKSTLEKERNTLKNEKNILKNEIETIRNDKKRSESGCLSELSNAKSAKFDIEKKLLDITIENTNKQHDIENLNKNISELYSNNTRINTEYIKTKDLLSSVENEKNIIHKDLQNTKSQLDYYMRLYNNSRNQVVIETASQHDSKQNLPQDIPWYKKISDKQFWVGFKSPKDWTKIHILVVVVIIIIFAFIFSSSKKIKIKR